MLFLSFTACDNSDEIGWNLTPPGEKFKYHIDSTTVVTAYTFRQDSVTCENRDPTLIGSINDPLFGSSSADIMAQLRLSSNEVDFGVNPKIDSVVMILKYAGYYGDTTSLQKISIHEMTRSLYYDSTYYSNLNPAGYYDSINQVGEISYYPTPSADSIYIRLSNDFGNRLLNTDTANLTDNDTWLAYFKGLYFKSYPAEGVGSLVYLNLADGNSRMVMYYHNDEADSLNFELFINSNSAWINLFKHHYEGTPILSKINDSTTVYPEVYAQSMGGLRNYIKFEFPDSITSIIESGVTINKAELIITAADDPTVTPFSRPASLRIYKCGDGYVNQYIDDLSLGEDYYGGTFNSTTSTYHFNIGRHIQSIMHPDANQRITNKGMLLVLTNERISGNRVILKNGPGNGSMKLVITYTPL